jgi:hypothetical protein
LAAAPFPLVDLGGAEEVWPDASHSWVSGMSCRRSRALCRASASRGGFGCAFMCRSWLSRLTVARELSCTAALLDRRMARARVRCGGRRLPLSPAARSADCERSAKEVQEQNAALISRSGLNLCPASNQAGILSLLRSGWRPARGCWQCCCWDRRCCPPAAALHMARPASVACGLITLISTAWALREARDKPNIVRLTHDGPPGPAGTD